MTEKSARGKQPVYCLKDKRGWGGISDISMLSGWLYAMLVILQSMLEEGQSCLSNAPLCITKDATSIEKQTNP